MGAWKHRGGGDWDLAVVVYAIVALSAATDVYGFQRFAPLPRPSKLVEQALGWEPLLQETMRRATRDCTRLVGDAMPEACRKRVELRKELAAAIEYERLSQRSEKLRIELQRLGAEAGGNSMARSFNLSLGRVVELEGKDGIALMGMTILTLTSCFGPFGLYLIGKAARPASPTAASASPNSRPTQVNGQGGVTAQTQYVPPNSSAKSAHDRPASDPAQPARQPAHAGLEEESETAQAQSVHGHTRPAQKSAQADSVPPAREQACSATSPPMSLPKRASGRVRGPPDFNLPMIINKMPALPPASPPSPSPTVEQGRPSAPPAKMSVPPMVRTARSCTWLLPMDDARPSMPSGRS